MIMASQSHLIGFGDMIIINIIAGIALFFSFIFGLVGIISSLEDFDIDYDLRDLILSIIYFVIPIAVLYEVMI